MNAYPLIVKLPGDVCQHINFFLVQNAQIIISQYYRSNPYFKYRDMWLDWEEKTSFWTTLRVWNYCLRRSEDGNNKVWTERALRWEPYATAYRYQISLTEAINFIEELYPNDK